MEHDLAIKKRWLIVAISTVLILLLIILFVVEKRVVTVKENSFKERTSGDNSTHLFHLNATVKEISIDLNQMVVTDVTDNSFFDTSEIVLDCSKHTLDLSKAEVGKQITFYFFNWEIKENVVNVQDLRY